MKSVAFEGPWFGAAGTIYVSATYERQIGEILDRRKVSPLDL